jgi:hypothetical protein
LHFIFADIYFFFVGKEAKGKEAAMAINVVFFGDSKLFFFNSKHLILN